MLKNIGKLIKGLGNVGIAISAIASVLMALMVTVGTILRYVFNRPLYFVEEYSAYVMVMMTFLGLAYTLRTGGHVTIDFLPDRLPKKGRAWLEVLTTLISLAMLILLIKYGWKLALNSLRNDLRANTVMLTALWIPQMFVVVGLFIFGLELIVNFISKINEIKGGFSKRDPNIEKGAFTVENLE